MRGRSNARFRIARLCTGTAAEKRRHTRGSQNTVSARPSHKGRPKRRRPMDPSSDARGKPESGGDASGVTRREILALAALALLARTPGSAIAARAEGPLVLGSAVSLAPISFGAGGV